MKEGDLFEYELPWEDLTLAEEDLYLSMGEGYVPDEEMLAAMHGLRSELSGICRPRGLFSIYDAGGIDGGRIRLAGIDLHPGAIITPYLEGAEYYALFVATAGREFQEFQRRVRESGDIFKEFLLDSIGSAIAEAAGRALGSRLETMASGEGLGVSYPYSPGYCGWHVSQQQPLFSLLPDRPCGIVLSESSLMYPIKSVSGIIAVGRDVRKLKYGCELCNKADCYKNRNRNHSRP